MPPVPPLGVAIVTYASADVIADCLETLAGAALADGTPLRIAVVDNASPDDTPARVRAWAEGTAPYAPPSDLPFPHVPVPKPLPAGLLEVIEAGANGGFAAGVNIGLRRLFADPAIGRVWILNPDSMVPPGTPAAFAAHDPGPFALMGGRVVYLDGSGRIQTDGGRIDWRTGVTHNVNQYRPAAAPPPDPAGFDFISGASMVASRAFWSGAGPVPEDYFLYYEEVDWALRRGALPLAYCPDARVFHRGGTAIGSGVPTRPASPLSLYFKHRARHRFLRRHRPARLPGAWAYTLAKTVQALAKGRRAEAAAILAGARDAAPPAGVRDRLGPGTVLTPRR